MIEAKEVREDLPQKKRKTDYYLVHVADVRGGERPYFVATEATDKDTAKRHVELMRPHSPILKKAYWETRAVYNLGDKKDQGFLLNHPNLEICLYAHETQIQTYIPIVIGRPLNTVVFRSKENVFLHALSLRNDSYVVGTRGIDRVSERISIHLLAHGQKKLLDLANLKEQLQLLGDRNISIIFYEETLGVVMQYIREVYEILEGKEIILNFFYVTKDEVYELFLQDNMSIYKIFG